MPGAQACGVRVTVGYVSVGVIPALLFRDIAQDPAQWHVLSCRVVLPGGVDRDIGQYALAGCVLESIASFGIVDRRTGMGEAEAVLILVADGVGASGLSDQPCIEDLPELRGIAHAGGVGLCADQRIHATFPHQIVDKHEFARQHQAKKEITAAVLTQIDDEVADVALLEIGPHLVGKTHHVLECDVAGNIHVGHTPLWVGGQPEVIGGFDDLCVEGGRGLHDACRHGLGSIMHGTCTDRHGRGLAVIVDKSELRVFEVGGDAEPMQDLRHGHLSGETDSE